MADGDGKPGIKDLFDTIKKSPALIATVLVAGGVLVYLLVKYGPSSSAKTQSTNSTLPSLTGQGSYIQPYIEPIVIPMSGGSSPAGGGAPGPVTGVTMPPASAANGTPGAGSTVPSSSEPYIGPVTGGGTNTPYFGLLGPRVQLLGNNQYQIPGVQGPTPLPLGLQSNQLTPGSQGRVWYSDPSTGQQRLLTSGVGPAVTNSPNGTVTQQTQSSSSSGGGTTNQQNSTSSTNRNNATIPANG